MRPASLTYCLIGLLCFVSLPAVAAKNWQQLISEGESQYENGELNVAEATFNEAMKAAQAFPPDDIRRARTLNDLGLVLEQSGKPAAAEPLLKKALQIRESKLGKTEPTADTLYNLGNLYRDQQKLKDAESSYMRAIAIFLTTVPKGAANLAATYNSLSTVHLKLGKPTEAEADLKRGIEYGEKYLKSDNDQLIDMTAKLATTYDKAGKQAQAKPYFKKYLASVYKAMEITAADPQAREKTEKFAAALRRTGQQADADLVEKALKYEAQ